MTDNRTIMVKRIDDFGKEHIGKMWQTQSNLPSSLRKRVQSIWSKNSAYAAEMLNNCAVNRYVHGSGFQIDSASDTAFLVTATIYPPQKFASYLLDKYRSGFQSGLGYLGKLEELLDDDEIGGLSFSQFHHWVITGGEHGVGLSCCIGGRKDGSDYDLLAPADPFFNEHEMLLFNSLGPTPIDSKKGIILPRSEREHLSDKWVCSQCKRIYEKDAASNILICPDCKWQVAGTNVKKGYYDAYEIMGRNGGISHLLYNELNSVVWKFIRKPDLDIKEETNDGLIAQFHQNEQKIKHLSTNYIGSKKETPPYTILYSAALTRLALGYSKVKNTSFLEAQKNIVANIGGCHKYVQRITSGYTVAYSEENKLIRDKKEPWWKFW